MDSQNSQPMTLIHRNITSSILDAMSDTPVILIQGARQVGKSTLIKMLSDQIDSMQVTFDDPTILAAARADPLSFVDQYPAGVLAIDEVQLFPEILRAIKLRVDENRRSGRFLLTGSANLLHTSGANESLAGRIETVILYPFSQGEINGRQEDFISRIINDTPNQALRQSSDLSRADYAAAVAAGGYPDVFTRSSRRRRTYYQNYLSSILDHDAVELSSLKHLGRLHDLVSVLSGQTSSEFVAAGVAKLVQIPETSISAYIRLLKDLYLINELSSWGRNITHRAVSRKKVSIVDTGLAAYLNGVDEKALADPMHGEALGALLESFVVSELFKQRTWSSEDYSIYHYRDRDKREINIIIELYDGRIIALEIKASQSASSKDFNGIRTIKDAMNDRFVCGLVLYTGADTLPFGDKLFAVPISTIWNT